MPKLRIWRALLVISFAGCDAKHDQVAMSASTATSGFSGPSVTVASSSPSQPMILLPEEVAVFNIRLAKAINDVAEYNSAPENIQVLTGKIIGVKAVELQKEYDQNAVTADQRYRDNTVIISGDVGVVGGSGTRYFVRFESEPDSSGSPRAEMAEGHTAFLAGLANGQNIILACRGAGTLMGNATLINCMSSNTYARMKVEDLLRRTSVSDIIATPGWLRQELILAVAYASELPKNSDCAASYFFGERCIALDHSIGMNYGDKSSDVSNRMTAFAFKKIGIESW